MSENDIEGRLMVDAEREEAREFAFEEGVVETLRMIDEKLQTCDTVIVCVCGSSTHVGKSYLTKFLLNGVYDRQIPVRAEKKRWNFTMENIMSSKAQYKSKKFVAILGQLWTNANLPDRDFLKKLIFESTMSKEVKDELFGQETDSIIFVGIYRKDLPFRNISEVKKAVDIIIHNDSAVDKSF